jgi:polysaccharide biosynthesis PFTS motif protein
MIYKPLWSYSAELHGSKIILYNWSAGFDDFLGPQGYPPTNVGQRIQNWNFILQWSLPYAEYLRSIILSKNVEVIVVPPIYFSDSTWVYNDTKPAIVIFDVTPQKRFFHDVLIPYVEYRTFETGKKFLEDIYEVAMNNGYQILWKRKRLFWPNHNKAYIKFSQKFINLPGVIEVDPRASAFRLVQEADIVISMPFTSTGIVAKSFKKPSVYYDPVNVIAKGDRGAQDILLLSGKEELLNWIKSMKNRTA